MRGLVALLGGLWLAAVGAMSAAAADLHRGDIVVVDSLDFEVYVVDPVTGLRGELITQGGHIEDPVAIALGPNNEIYVVDNANDRIVEIDAATGAQSILTEGGFILNPTDAVVTPEGDLLVTEQAAKAPRVLRITPAGAQSVEAEGGFLDTPTGIALDGQDIVVVDDSFLEDPKVIRIASDGSQQVVTSGGNLRDPIRVAVDASGIIYVLDNEDFFGPQLVIRVTRRQDVIASSDDEDVFFLDMRGLELEADGNLVLGDNLEAIYRLNPTSGIVSDVSSYPEVSIVEDLAVVRVPEPRAGGALAATTLAALPGWSRRRGRGRRRRVGGRGREDSRRGAR